MGETRFAAPLRPAGLRLVGDGDRVGARPREAGAVHRRARARAQSGLAGLGLEPLEASIRTEIGALVDPARLDEAPGLIDKLLADPERFRAKAAALRAQSVFNLGRSAEVAAAEIARLADERARERKRAP